MNWLLQIWYYWSFLFKNEISLNQCHWNVPMKIYWSLWMNLISAASNTVYLQQKTRKNMYEYVQTEVKPSCSIFWFYKKNHLSGPWHDKTLMTEHTVHLVIHHSWWMRVVSTCWPDQCIVLVGWSLSLSVSLGRDFWREPENDCRG